MFNINYGHNDALMDKCRMLEEYAEFVAISRQYIASGMELQTALNMAIDYCMEHGILYDILKEYRAEVLGMLLEEFDVDKYERTIRMEGMQQGIDRVNRLTGILLEQNRTEDLKRSLEDAEYQKKLFREFRL